MNIWRTKEQKKERDKRIVEMRDNEHLGFDVIGQRLEMHESCANTNYHRIKKEQKERREKAVKLAAEIFDVFFQYVTCSHREEFDEKGRYFSNEYDVDSPCEQKIIEILEKEL